MPAEPAGRFGDLQRRIGRKLEQGRSIRLSAADVDLLTLSGAYAALSRAADEELLELVRARNGGVIVGDDGDI